MKEDKEYSKNGLDDFIEQCKKVFRDAKKYQYVSLENLKYQVMYEMKCEEVKKIEKENEDLKAMCDKLMIEKADINKKYLKLERKVDLEGIKDKVKITAVVDVDKHNIMVKQICGNTNNIKVEELEYKPTVREIRNIDMVEVERRIDAGQSTTQIAAEMRTIDGEEFSVRTLYYRIKEYGIKTKGRNRRSK